MNKRLLLARIRPVSMVPLVVPARRPMAPSLALHLRLVEVRKANETLAQVVVGVSANGSIREGDEVGWWQEYPDWLSAL
ncbi:MAG: hypothetical protein ACK4IT_06845 [Thioalkalivibrionaceae bacterium]